MKDTLIEWAHHTVNFWWGCVFARFADGTVRQECVHCYAKMMAALFSRGKATWGSAGERWIRHEAARRELYKLDKSAHERGVRERIFINSMSDTFEERADLDEARAMLWAACKFVTNLDILLLTKRPENVLRMVPREWLGLGAWPAQVWIGTTCGTQRAADEVLAALREIPARTRFISVEPLLEPIEFASLEGIDWVIVGGESGPKARPMDSSWVRAIREQCRHAGSAFFFKQWGEYLPRDQRAPAARESLIGQEFRRVGKKNAGRLLDGTEYSEFPLYKIGDFVQYP